MRCGGDGVRSANPRFVDHDVLSVAHVGVGVHAMAARAADPGVGGEQTTPVARKTATLEPGLRRVATKTKVADAGMISLGHHHGRTKPWISGRMSHRAAHPSVVRRSLGVERCVTLRADRGRRKRHAHRARSGQIDLSREGEQDHERQGSESLAYERPKAQRQLTEQEGTERRVSAVWDSVACRTPPLVD
jgi:hypothetical protein